MSKDKVFEQDGEISLILETDGKMKTYSLKQCVNSLAIELMRDIVKYRKGETELSKQIKLENSVLLSLTEALKAIQ